MYDLRLEYLSKLEFKEIFLNISDLEIQQCQRQNITEFIIRKIRRAVHDEVTRPFRVVLGCNGQAKE